MRTARPLPAIGARVFVKFPMGRGKLALTRCGTVIGHSVRRTLVEVELDTETFGLKKLFANRYRITPMEPVRK